MGNLESGLYMSPARLSSRINFKLDLAHESFHQDFGKIWHKYDLRDIQQPKYREQLLKATLKFNG